MRLILLYLNSEQGHLHRDLMEFNQFTLNSDHSASLGFFSSTCLCRLTYDSTYLRNGWRRVRIYTALQAFSWDMASASYFHIHVCTQKVWQHICTLLQFSKKLASENNQDPLHHNHTQTLINGTQEVKVVLPGLTRDSPPRKIETSVCEGALLPFFVNCLLRTKSWGDTNTIS